MRIPTVFINIQNAGGSNPLAAAIRKIVFGAKVVDQLVDDEETEADIAITNSVGGALKMVKDSAATVIVIAHFTQAERAAAEAFAARFPDRVRAVSYLGGESKMAIVPLLLSLIAEKSRRPE